MSDDWLDGKVGPPGAMETSLSSFSWSPDQSMIAFVLGSIVRVIDSATLQVIRDLNFHPAGEVQASGPCGPVFSPDGALLLTAYRRNIYVVSTSDWQVVNSYKLQLDSQQEFDSRVKSADSMNLLALKSGLVVRKTMEQIIRETEHAIECDSAVDSLGWLNGKSEIFAASAYGWYRLVNPDGEIRTKNVVIDELRFCYFYLAPNKELFARFQNNIREITVFRVDSGELVLRKKLPLVNSGPLHWAPDSSKLAFARYRPLRISIFVLADQEILDLVECRDIYILLILPGRRMVDILRCIPRKRVLLF
ncbi:MAG: hypothetical protein SFV17_22315 [Candidatus Obscuribacter sp.]|nr:hypothetical protein [Candidatus Obscuribacter sp.]